MYHLKTGLMVVWALFLLGLLFILFIPGLITLFCSEVYYGFAKYAKRLSEEITERLKNG